MTEFRYMRKIRLHDTDCGGIVYHANYIVWSEEALADVVSGLALENVLLDPEEIRIEYMRPGTAGKDAEILTTLEEASGSSAVLRQVIRSGEDTLAEISLKAVLRSYADLSPVEFPSKLTHS